MTEEKPGQKTRTLDAGRGGRVHLLGKPIEVHATAKPTAPRRRVVWLQRDEQTPRCIAKTYREGRLDD